MVTDVYGYFIDSSDRDYAVMALDQMKKLFSVKTSTANQFTLILEEEADENQVRNEALGWFGRDISEIITGGQKYAWAVKGIDDDFFVFEMLLVITGLLAGIGVMNTLLIGGLERRREFGLLQALGVTSDQLYRIVLFEGLIIGLAGGVLAILFGLPLSWIIVESLRLLSALPLTFTPDLTWIGISFLASVFVATAAGLYPAWKTLHIPVTQSVKYE
jgi:putative ABC transport system permease protein